MKFFDLSWSFISIVYNSFLRSEKSSDLENSCNFLSLFKCIKERKNEYWESSQIIFSYLLSITPNSQSLFDTIFKKNSFFYSRYLLILITRQTSYEYKRISQPLSNIVENFITT